MNVRTMTTSELLARDAEIGNRLDGFFDVPLPAVSALVRMSQGRSLLAERREIRTELERRRAEEQAWVDRNVDNGELAHYA